MSSPRLDDKRAGQRTMEALEREIEVKLTAEHVSAAWRTKDAKAWRDLQIGMGRTVITPDDLVTVTGMAESLGRHPVVKAGILDGHVERSLIWKDEETGIWLKSRPDVIPNASAVVADLKTTTSVTTASLEKSLAAFSYHVQAAVVAMGLRELLSVEMEEFALVWVEKAPPYCVRVTTLSHSCRGRLLRSDTARHRRMDHRTTGLVVVRSRHHPA